MKILNSKQKKEISRELEKTYGINEIPFQILRFGEEKLRIFSGNLPKEDLEIFDKELRIESIGLYFLKQENDGLRLTFDALTVFKDQINKNILELSEKDAKEWLKGFELQIKSDKSYKVLKHNNELIGCGKSTSEKIANFVPKERRVK